MGVAARMAGLHAQTLRYYERAGLLTPARSEGNRRYYSERDLERVRRIKTLMDDLGMNLAGVEVVLRLMERLTEMEQQAQQLLAEVEHLRAQGRPPALREGKPHEQGQQP
ncbi:MAG: MerR family transcriptional regulator [Chloroflexi bacterium]|nr:MerR family transcriptional regulator [Chloroflexota bacterium]